MPRKNREKYIGWCEAAGGTGFLFGPLMGAVLYGIGGFILPFVTFAAAYMITFPYLAYVVYSSLIVEKNNSDYGKKKQLPQFLILKNPRCIFGLLS